MQSIKNVIDEIMRKDVIDTNTCEKCNETYEVYYLFYKDELKAFINYCTDCKRKEEDEKLQKEIQEFALQKKTGKYDWLSVVPFELEGATFDNYEPKNETQNIALGTSIDFANNMLSQTTLFFQGDTGLGKTHLSYSVYKEIRNQIKSCIFIDLPSLLSSIRNTYGNNLKHSQEQIMEAISDCDLLVLDDIGAEYVKPDANGFESWAADILFQIANARQGKKNIYTTNFTAKYLTKKYGMMSKRIISRLMSNAKIIKVEGDDHRLKGLD